MTTVGVNRRDPIAEFADLGRFFAGDLGAQVAFALIKETGGLYDLSPVNGVPPIVEAVVRRFDAQHRIPMGAIVAAGPLTIYDPPQTTYKGWVVLDWLTMGGVPTETGWYIVQLRVTPPDGRATSTQRAVFYVEPGFGL